MEDDLARDGPAQKKVPRQTTNLIGARNPPGEDQEQAHCHRRAKSLGRQADVAPEILDLPPMHDTGWVARESGEIRLTVLKGGSPLDRERWVEEMLLGRWAEESGTVY